MSDCRDHFICCFFNSKWRLLGFIVRCITHDKTIGHTRESLFTATDEHADGPQLYINKWVTAWYGGFESF